MNAARFTRVLAAFGLAATLAVLAGCATPAHKENMVTEAIPSVRKLPHTVTVETRGGAGTGLADSSNVSDADLKAAIENSIAKSSLFRSVVPGRGGDYELTVSITSLDKPLFGGAFTVTLETGWSLVKASDRSVVLRKAIKSQHTVSVGESFVGATRLRLALEGAVRKNITEGLQAISQAPI